MRRSIFIMALALWPGLAHAGLTEEQIGRIGFDPPQGARVPLSLQFRAVGGYIVTLRDAIDGRPTLLLPADFTCKQICGPALTIASSALQQTGFIAGRDYSLVVVGIDPRDTIDDARRFTQGQIGGTGTSVLTGSQETVAALLGAIGYHTETDDKHDAIAHPAAFVTLAPDGRVVRALSSLALQPVDIRLALLEAGDGRIGGLSGRVALLCYGFDAVHGIYTRRITVILQIVGASTVAIMAAFIGLMLVRSRGRGASA
ncbi:SCO family protein [Bradyrhizobium canariense]|uniref:SCO family protein n=1 Tax=Bradyrhizobium canariense TaxID=255045 RepID=A0ABX3X5H3_9BRAD|nr:MULTISPECIES: SCO family protein [Bradyrhizobium]OSJ17352.1 SCO family protein [Bradyrhizobium canariense]OSJ30521.1 SCO family protein [Bradyrhizobium canariense]WOH61819.1 SCO family protein [Bradyrhizobium sp. BWC-3-1]